MMPLRMVLIRFMFVQKMSFETMNMNLMIKRPLLFQEKVVLEKSSTMPKGNMLFTSEHIGFPQKWKALVVSISTTS